MKNLKKVFFGIALISTICLNSCTMLKPGLINQNDFASNALEMKVTGRYGWTFNKVVRFGSFYTSAFDCGGYTSNSDSPEGMQIGFVNYNHSTAHQEYKFKQYDSLKNFIDVSCIADRKADEVKLLTNVSADQVLNTYTIKLLRNGVECSLNYSDDSTIMRVEGDSLTIIKESKLDTEDKKVFNGVIFKHSEKTVAAVDLTNSGIVWISNSIDRNQQLMIAAISTAILLKPDLNKTR